MVSNCQSLMSRFNVQGFPTILVFGADKDSPSPYEGARTASAIESFALEQLETNVAPPEVVELTGPVKSSLPTKTFSAPPPPFSLPNNRKAQKEGGKKRKK